MTDIVPYEPSSIAIWVYSQVIDHSNMVDSYGVSCDERGCSICNADSKKEAADWWVDSIENPAPGDYFDWHAPNLEQIVEALDWWDNGGKEEWEDEVNGN